MELRWLRNVVFSFRFFINQPFSSSQQNTELTVVFIRDFVPSSPFTIWPNMENVAITNNSKVTWQLGQ